MESQLQNTSNNNKPARLLSLDALRGFDMFWIISGEGIFHGLAEGIKKKHALIRNPIDWQIATSNDLSWIEQVLLGVSNQLHHSPWNGFTFYDLIFPLFIFIAGISMPFSFSKKMEGSKKAIYKSLFKRTVILILLGMVVNGALQFDGFENTRFASVLGRIALACFFAAIIYLNNTLKKQIGWFVFLLIGYWAAMVLIPVPVFGKGVLTEQGNLSAYLDRLLLPGKLHRVMYDPEGLLSTIPAVCSAMLGVFTGQFLLWSSQKWSPSIKLLWLVGVSVVFILLGLLWNTLFPINKSIWSSSFVLYAGGWSLLLFTLFYYLIDVKECKKWSIPFVWVGTNSILIYVAAHGLVNFEYSAVFLFGGLISKMPEIMQAGLLWTGVAIIQLTILYLLNRKKWFLKI
jgi:predicted acyltransferase